MSQPLVHALPSYLDANHLGPWGVYLQQVDRVTPYLGSLARWVETLKRPKRALVWMFRSSWTMVRLLTSRVIGCSTIPPGVRARAGCVSTRM